MDKVLEIEMRRDQKDLLVASIRRVPFEDEECVARVTDALGLADEPICISVGDAGEMSGLLEVYARKISEEVGSPALEASVLDTKKVIDDAITSA